MLKKHVFGGVIVLYDVHRGSSKPSVAEGVVWAWNSGAHILTVH